VCAFFSTLIIWELHFKVQTSFEAHNFVLLLSFSLHSSFPTFKLLSMASNGGELLLDSSSPWSGISSTLLLLHSAAIKIQEAKDCTDEEDPRPTSSNGATSCGIRASSSRWCSFASYIFLFGQFTLIPCYSSYSSCISSIVLWFDAV